MSQLIALKTKVTKPLLIMSLILIVLGFFWGWGYWSIAAVIISFVAFINGLYTVPVGQAGYLTILEKPCKNVYEGYGWMIPFISSVVTTEIISQYHRKENLMKNVDRRDVIITYELTWNVKKDAVLELSRKHGLDVNTYVAKTIAKSMDECFTIVIASMTYDEINGHLDDVKQQALNKFETAYDKELFENINVSITDVKFDKDYEESVALMAKTEIETHIKEEQAKQKEIDAKGEAEALKIKAQAAADALKMKAEAEAEGMRLKGASENEIRERLGEILKTHPELIQEVLAKNFPKVVGSTMPTFNLNEILG